MKKFLICLTLLALLVLSLGSCSTDTPDSNDPSSNNASENTIGDYTVVIDSIRAAKDYEDEPIVIIKYIFTNNDDEPHAFVFSIDASAYQNGVELSHCYFADDSANYQIDDQNKEIQPNTTFAVEIAYELNDTKSNIDVEVKELFSFTDKKLTKTFEISSMFATDESNTEKNTEHNTEKNTEINTEINTEKNTENNTESNTEANTSGSGNDNTSSENALGKYEVVIDSCRAAYAYDGDPVIIVKYLFTNNSDSADSFTFSIDDAVYQNGVELSHCYVVDESANYSSDAKSKDIQPGVTLEVEVAYELNDKTSDISIELTELFAIFDSSKITKTLEIDSLFRELDESTANMIGNYTVVIDSCRIVTTGSGEPVVIVKYLFTNNGSEPAAFIYSLSSTVYQNGVELSNAYLVSTSENNYSSANQMTKVATGVTLEVEKAYKLNDTTTPIDVEVSKLYSSTGSKKITATLDLPA